MCWSSQLFVATNFSIVARSPHGRTMRAVWNLLFPVLPSYRIRINLPMHNACVIDLRSSASKCIDLANKSIASAAPTVMMIVMIRVCLHHRNRVHSPKRQRQFLAGSVQASAIASNHSFRDCGLITFIGFIEHPLLLEHLSLLSPNLTSI